MTVKFMMCLMPCFFISVLCDYEKQVRNNIVCNCKRRNVDILKLGFNILSHSMNRSSAVAKMKPMSKWMNNRLNVQDNKLNHEYYSRVYGYPQSSPVECMSTFNRASMLNAAEIWGEDFMNNVASFEIFLDQINTINQYFFHTKYGYRALQFTPMWGFRNKHLSAADNLVKNIVSTCHIDKGITSFCFFHEIAGNHFSQMGGTHPYPGTESINEVVYNVYFLIALNLLVGYTAEKYYYLEGYSKRVSRKTAKIANIYNKFLTNHRTIAAIALDALQEASRDITVREIVRDPPYIQIKWFVKEFHMIWENLNSTGSCSCGNSRPADFCSCEDHDYNPNAAGTFSLREVTSNTVNNMVIIGLRFIEKNGMIYIQIQEGKLKSMKSIACKSERWVSVDTFDFTSNAVPHGDFFSLEYPFKRSVNLDTLSTSDDFVRRYIEENDPYHEFSSPDSYVLTGVKFGTDNGHVSLGIRLTAVNITTGKLILNEWDNWIFDYVTLFRQPIRIENADVPTKPQDNVEMEGEDPGKHFVQFETTDMEKDFGLTTIPFLDSQDITAHCPMPLSGAGLYYKGKPGYGGFIALKLISIDFSQFIKT